MMLFCVNTLKYVVIFWTSVTCSLVKALANGTDCLTSVITDAEINQDVQSVMKM